MVTVLSMESLAHVLEKTLLEKVATQVKESLEESSELFSLAAMPLLEMSDEDSWSCLSRCQALCLKMLRHCQVLCLRMLRHGQVVKVQVDIHGAVVLEVLAEEKVA